ncbi:MAG: hypothetical protein HY909_18030 [Deltaproteobacteria bacterium]|nr:hypothetical protein [Deltaproteobacteria bacterium]
MRPRARAWLLAAGLWGAGASAQTAPGAAASQGAAPPPPPDDAASSANDPAWREAVDEATRLLAAGRVTEARALLRRALEGRALDPTGYDALAVLQRLADAMDLSAPADSDPAPGPADARRGPAPRSSFELVTLYGTGLAFGGGTGLWVDALAEIDNARAGVWIPLLGAGLGVLGAYALDRGEPLRAGRATAMNTGMLLGAAAGLSVALQHHDSIDIETDRCFGTGSLACDARFSDRWRARGIATSMWLGAGLGLGLGYGVSALTDSSPGSASYVLSAGAWGGLLGLFAGILGRFDNSLGAFWLAGSGVGTAAALATAHVLRPTQAQTRWLDLGVLGGGLLGLGAAVLVDQNLSDRVVPLALIELGMVGGGLTAFLLSRSLDARGRARTRAHHVPGVLPLTGGGLVTVTFTDL